MDTVIDTQIIMPIEEAGCGRGPVDRGNGKPRQRFADVPALAEVREESGPVHKKKVAADEAELPGPPAVPGLTSRRKSSPDPEQAVLAGVSAWTMPVRPPAVTGQVAVGSKTMPVPSVIAKPSDVAAGKATGKAPNAGSAQPAISDKGTPVAPRSSDAPATLLVKEVATGVKAPQTEADGSGKRQVQTAKQVSPDTGVPLAQEPRKIVMATGTTVRDSPVLPAQTKQTSAVTTAHERTGPVPPPRSGGEAPPVTGSALPSTPGLPPKNQPLPATSKSDQTLQKTPPAGEFPTVQGVQASRQTREPVSLNEPQRTSPEGRVAAAGKTPKAEVSPPPAPEAQADGAKQTLHVQSDVPLLSSTEPVASTARTPVPTQMPMNPDPGTTRNPAQNLGAQILDSMHASLARGDRQVVVRLHPPELGTVLVRFQEDGHQVSALVEVARGDTRREVEQALPGVLRGLQDAGIQVKRFEVVTSDLPEKDLARGQTQQDGWAQHQSPGQPREQFTPSPRTRWPQAGPDYPGGSPGAPAVVSAGHVPEGRIDLLL